MKNVLAVIFLFVLNYAEGQVKYFQRRFNIGVNPTGWPVVVYQESRLLQGKRLFRYTNSQTRIY